MNHKPRHSIALVSWPTWSIGQRLRRERLRLGWSQERLAEELQTSANSISRWERDVVLPHPHFQRQLAQVFHSTVESLFLLDEPGDESRVAPVCTKYCYVPYLRNPYFTGRQEVLEQLHSQLHTFQSTITSRLLALCGLGGIGKTQLALEYVYQHAGDYTATFWIAAETAETIMESFAHLAEVLGLPEHREMEQQRMADAVQHWLITHQGWLLIWDNVEDIDLFWHFAPKAGSGAMLLTTRRQGMGTLAAGIEISSLSLQESLCFLLCRARLLPSGASQEQVEQFALAAPAQVAAAQELVAIMDGLPLALDQVGAYVEETRCSLMDYLQQYHHRQADLLRRRGSVALDYPHSVATTWSLSFERVGLQNPVVPDVLKICAMLHPEAIPEDIFILGAQHIGERLASMAGDPLQFDEALSTLALYSLLRRNGEDHTLSMHRLVQAVLRARMSEQEQVIWLKRAVAALNATFPEVTPEAWRLCERLIPHVLTVVSAIPDQSGERELAEVLWKAASYLSDRARYEQAELLYQRVLRIKEMTLGAAHLEVAPVQVNLAVLSGIQGKYERAEQLLQDALHTNELALGPDHLDVARILNNLATLYQGQAKYEQAEQLYERVLRICERELGALHPHMAYPLTGLADLYVEQGKYEQAAPLYQQALHTMEQAMGPEHPLVADSLSGLADLYYQQGIDEQAEALWRRALRIWENALGAEHFQVASPLIKLGKLYTRHGKYRQAETLYQHALHITGLTVKQEHPLVANILNGLASLYSEQGKKYEQAEQLYQHALHLLKQCVGQDHPEIARSLVGLARLYEKQSKSAQAEPLLQRAYTIFERHLGRAHSETIEARNAYSSLLEQREKTIATLCDERTVQKTCTDALQANVYKYYMVPSALSGTAQAASMQEADPLADFLTARCELYPRAWSRASDLWQAYEQWTTERRERFPLSRRAFAAHLKARGCQAGRTSTSRIWRGIALRGSAT